MTLPLGRLAALGPGLAALALPATAAADAVTETYSAPGTYTLTIPQYTSSVNVIASGAGGTGATGGGGGGGGGAGAPASRFSLGGAPPWLSIDPATGVISGTIPPLTAGRFTFTITAGNGVGTPATQDFTLDVTGPPVTVTPSPPLKGNVGLPLGTS